MAIYERRGNSIASKEAMAIKARRCHARMLTPINFIVSHLFDFMASHLFGRAYEAIA